MIVDVLYGRGAFLSENGQYTLDPENPVIVRDATMLTDTLATQQMVSHLILLPFMTDVKEI